MIIVSIKDVFSIVQCTLSRVWKHYLFLNKQKPLTISVIHLHNETYFHNFTSQVA